jgi:hypothetical protein
MRSLAVALAVLTLAAPAAAQEKPAPTVDVERLPVDVARIQRELQRQAEVEERDGLNLRYSLHVYGVAPRLQFFSEDEDLTTGPVPWGAPTHQEMINHITPQEYRAPFADFSALFRWLAERKPKEEGRRQKE